MDAQIIIADGRVVKAKDTILVTLRIKLKRYDAINHEFLVVDFPGHDQILRSDLMKRHLVIIDARKRTFQFGKGNAVIDTPRDMPDNNQEGSEKKPVTVAAIQKISKITPEGTGRQEKNLRGQEAKH